MANKKKKKNKSKKKKNITVAKKNVTKVSQKGKNKSLKKSSKSVIAKDSKLKTETTKLSKKTKELKKKVKEFNSEKLKNKVLNIEEQKRISEELNNSDNKVEKENFEISLKFILFLILISTLVIFLVVAFKKDKYKDKKIEFDEISINEYFDLYNDKNLVYVYIKENNCVYCNLIEEYLNKLEIDYKINVQELNISALDEEEIKKLEKSNSIFEDGWKAPLVFSINNGKEISSISGYKEYSVFKKFVEYSNNPTDTNSFISISIDKYISILNSNEFAIVYIGRYKNNGCKAYNPILESVTKKKNIKVYYMDTDSLDTEKDWSKLKNSNDIFKDTWFTPATLIIKDGDIIDYRFESMDVESLEYFLNKNGV